MRYLFRSVAAASMAALVVGSVWAQDKEPLRIGVIDPITGPMASVGLESLATIEFEAERLNAQGGINGHPIEVIAYDNKVSPQESLVQLQKALNDGINYIAEANGSAVASALLSAIDKHNRRTDTPALFLNFGAVDPVFTNEKCSFWHFRFDAHADMKMKALTDWISGNENIHKIFLINQDYSFGHAVSEQARIMLEEKRPDIEIVGDVFHPIAKVKDFTPYVSQIRASGADAVITGNWGADMALLGKAASSAGLEIPFLTYYAHNAGTVTQLDSDGVDRIYLVAGWNGDYEDPEMAARQEKMRAEKKWDYRDIRVTHMMEMLKRAAEKADSIDPVKVAWAMEDVSYESPAGKATMRAEDHQILAPLYISLYKDKMEYGAEGTEYNFHALKHYAGEDTALPTTCKMKRPDR